MIIFWGCVLIGALAVLSWEDLKTYRLSDAYTLPLIAAGLIQTWSLGYDLPQSLLGGVMGYSLFVALELIHKRFRGRAGLGRGDAKLLAVGGTWCGALYIPYIVTIASIMGLVGILLFKSALSNEKGWIPFGPFLALGIALVWIAKAKGL